ncbi:DUF1684 domain-containing protein [Wenyingzhuangia sp. IMCC45533]
MKKTITFLLFFCFMLSNTYAQKSYKELITLHRTELNNHFKDKTKSPLPKTKRKKFNSLPFFPINSKYKVKAKLTYTFNSPVFYMETTGTQKDPYQQYALATFMLDGKEYTLSIYQNIALKNKRGYQNYLFIPFTDITNGTTTYSGGRYIDTTIPENPTGYITLDFNKAYNPYCAYNKNFVCPIPPKNNHIATKILAGVKY